MSQQRSAFEILKESHPINAQVLVQAAICRRLPANSVVAVENLNQSILASLVKKAGLASVTVIGEPIIRKYGASLLRALEEMSGAVEYIGNNNAELSIQPKVQAGFTNLAQETVKVHLKTVDAAFLGRSNIGWLAFDTGDAALLASAENTVNEHRPLISFASFDDLAIAKKWCKERNYLLLNADLDEPLTTGPQGLYLFPDSDFLRLVQNTLCPAIQLSNANVVLNTQIKHTWPQICGVSDPLTRQVCTYLQVNERTYDLKEMIGFNLYSSELHGDTTWRWTGPGHDAVLLLPMRTRGLFTVELTVLALPENIAHTVVRCFMNGNLHFEGNVSEGSHISFTYYVDNPHAPVELLISAEKTAFIAGRELGIAISAVKVKWETQNA